MKNSIISIILIVIFSACASKEQKAKMYTNLIKNEADCDKVSDLEVPDDFTMMGGTSFRYINATCDGQRIRCKQSTTVNMVNPFASSNQLSCKVLKKRT